MDVFRASLPSLERHQKAIIVNFYNKLFNESPSILSDSNDLEDQQKMVIADAIFTAMKNMDLIRFLLNKEEGFNNFVNLQLPIQPEQYPLVGDYLLAAMIEEVEVTDEIKKAWKQVFEAVLEALVQNNDQNKTVTKSNLIDEDGFRKLIVEKKVIESDLVISLYLKAMDEFPLDAFEPGQHVRIKVRLPEEEDTHIRYFSLSDSPEKDYYRVTIKKDLPKEEGILTPTNYLYDVIKEGDTIYVSAPAGSFILEQELDTPVVLLSGGVGMTPLVSMLNAIVAKQPHRPVTFIHATTNSKTHSFRSYLKELEAKHDNVRTITFYDSPTDEDRVGSDFNVKGYVTLKSLKQYLPNNTAHFYFCGPTPFMKAVYSSLKEWGVPKERIHYEYFGPGDLESEV